MSKSKQYDRQRRALREFGTSDLKKAAKLRKSAKYHELSARIDPNLPCPRSETVEVIDHERDGKISGQEFNRLCRTQGLHS